VPEIRTAWRQMIHDYAKREDYTYVVSGDNLVFRFSDGPGDRTLFISFEIAGNFLTIRMGDDRYLSKDDIPLALAAVNRFNEECFIPRAFVRQTDTGRYDISGEWHIPAAASLTDEGVDEMMDAALAGMSGLFAWLDENYSIQYEVDAH
jgi:hypothetical protein